MTIYIKHAIRTLMLSSKKLLLTLILILNTAASWAQIIEDVDEDAFSEVVPIERSELEIKQFMTRALLQGDHRDYNSFMDERFGLKESMFVALAMVEKYQYSGAYYEAAYLIDMQAAYNHVSIDKHLWEWLISLWEEGLRKGDFRCAERLCWEYLTGINVARDTNKAKEMYSLIPDDYHRLGGEWKEQVKFAQETVESHHVQTLKPDNIVYNDTLYLPIDTMVQGCLILDFVENNGGDSTLQLNLANFIFIDPYNNGCGIGITNEDKWLFWYTQGSWSKVEPYSETIFNHYMHLTKKSNDGLGNDASTEKDNVLIWHNLVILPEQ